VIEDAASPATRMATLVARTEGLQPWRRIFHALCGLIVVALLVGLEPEWIVATGVLGVLTLVVLAADLLRLVRPELNRLFFRLFPALASPREERRLASSTWFLLGVFFAVVVFPREVTIPAILVLALADPAASWMGRRWGRRRFGAGTVVGSTVFFLVAALVLAPFVGPGVALAAAAVIALLEAAPWPVDDNLVIPLAAGVVLWSLLPFWG
jgi:dolichol kinase